MKVDEILARKRDVLAQRREELEAQERGEGDNFNLFFLEEELADLNAQLRALRGGPRSVGSTNSQLSMDYAQYKDWLASDRDDEMHKAHQTYIDAVKSSSTVLTDRQKEIFDLWQSGMKVSDIAERLCVDISTVSRTLTRGKIRMREEAERLSKCLKLNDLSVFDMSDRDVAKVILSCLTSYQAVCIYLYYGEWLNLRDCGELLGVDHTAVLRAVQRGLNSIQNTLRCGSFTLDNVDALGDLAYELYLEHGGPDEGNLLPPTKRKLWARHKLGYIIPKKSKPLALYVIRTSDGLISGKPHHSKMRPKSVFLRLLYEIRTQRLFTNWLKMIFGKLTKKRADLST